jgi:molecular chaperone HscC
MIVGIDLGTTNSAISVWQNGEARLIPNSLGHVLTPSAISLDETDGTVLVGLPARERQSTHPGLTATAFKRYMGSTRRTKLGKREFLPEELSALVLQRLKADAEAYLGEPVTEAVITVPAYFNDKQRKATRRAGEMAGLKVERLLNEPTAAALAYGIHELSSESRFMVFDLGGGTFDVSILEIFEGVIEVRASTGDTQLGGEDFNTAIIEAFQGQLAKPLPETDRGDPVLTQRLREAAERARRTLSDNASVRMAVTWKEESYEADLSHDAFEAAAASLVTRLREPVLRALRDAGIRAEELREVVLVGGSTRMPLVRRAVTRMFGRFPSHAVHPDEAVAIGAAVQAGLKARDIALKEVVMTDVCPYTLGVEAAETGPGNQLKTGLFSPIIERNTIIPASRVERYWTIQADQRKMDIIVYQGESRQVADNVMLGKLTVDTPPGRQGEVFVDVRFTYDINGLLEVDVHVPATGKRAELVILSDESMSAEQVESRRKALAQLKQHPRDDDANRHALARAMRCYENFLGDRRAMVGSWIGEFETALDRQDPRAIDHARAELLKQLDALEGETWL